MTNYNLMKLDVNGDNDGRLIACQYKSNCPFDVKRVFWIFDTKAGIMRGAHANKNSQFLLVAINGSCKIKVDNGKQVEVFELNNPYTGLYLDKMIWKEMYDFSHNAILLVLTNTLYDEKEYIRDYHIWKREITNGKY